MFLSSGMSGTLRGIHLPNEVRRSIKERSLSDVRCSPSGKRSRSDEKSRESKRCVNIDDVVRQAIISGTGQVVILGAGLDTRAF